MRVPGNIHNDEGTSADLGDGRGGLISDSTANCGLWHGHRTIIHKFVRR